MRTSNDASRLLQAITRMSLDTVIDDSIVTMLSLHHYDEKEWMLDAGSKVTSLYILLEGKAGVTPSSADGKVSLLDFILPGDIIGDLEYFTQEDYFHSVITLTPCTTLVIPITLIEKIAHLNGDFYRYICENLAGKMKRTSKQLSSALLYPLKDRLAKYLYDLSIFQETADLVINTTQLSGYFGISPRHLRRVLAEFEEDGILIRSGTHVTLLDMSQLEGYMD